MCQEIVMRTSPCAFSPRQFQWQVLHIFGILIAAHSAMSDAVHSRFVVTVSCCVIVVSPLMEQSSVRDIVCH